MAYNFKNLNEVERQDKPTENTTVMSFESGQPRQIPASEFGGKGLVVDLRGYTLSIEGPPTTISDMSYDPIYEAITAGQNVVFQMKEEGMDALVTPLVSLVEPGTGFGVLCTTPRGNLTIIFTNGSYHTTA